MIVIHFPDFLLACFPDFLFAHIRFHWPSHGRKRDSVCFIGWTPDNAKIRQKMLYGATQESFKGTLEGIKSTIVAHDRSDLDDGRTNVLAK